jgi:hypothetical protein
MLPSEPDINTKMLNKYSAFGLVMVTSCRISCAQIAIPPDKLSLAPGSTPGCQVEWVSIPGRTYFPQVSVTLTGWVYSDVIEYGDGGTLGWSFDITASAKFFTRLKYTDDPTTEPALEDFDGDGVNSIVEVAVLLTDPLAYNSFVDADADGLVDAWEIHFWGNTSTANGGGDSDGDGLTNLEELQVGLNPILSELADGGLTTTLEYDKVGRLKLVISPATPAKFTPDAEGNILTAQPQP